MTTTKIATALGLGARYNRSVDGQPSIPRRNPDAGLGETTATTATTATTRAEIVLENIRKSYGARAVLRGVSLRIDEGEMVAVVGASGSGKTVLLHHMLGLVAPDTGRVLVADHAESSATQTPLVEPNALSDDAIDAVRVRWGVVFQRNALYSGTVYENLALWLREHTDLSEEHIARRIAGALQAVGFEPAEGVLQRTRETLSGGMAKRVAVARAVVMDPAVLFYDEPTTGLDPRLSAQLHALVGQTHRRRRGDGGARTSIVVTHDRTLLERLRPRVVVLAEGQVVYDGAYGTLAGAQHRGARAFAKAAAVAVRTSRKAVAQKP